MTPDIPAEDRALRLVARALMLVVFAALVVITTVGMTREPSMPFALAIGMMTAALGYLIVVDRP